LSGVFFHNYVVLLIHSLVSTVLLLLHIQVVMLGIFFALYLLRIIAFFETALVVIFLTICYEAVKLCQFS